MSPMAPSPVDPLSPARQLNPSRPPSAAKQMTPEEVLSPPPVSPLQPKVSPSPPTHQRPPSPLGQAPQSSGSASSSSDSGSDSGSDSSDDSEDEAGNAQPAKGPTTPPSVSPKNENLIEEPLPAIEESKPRWNLSSFFNKTAVPHGEQSSENKQPQVRFLVFHLSLWASLLAHCHVSLTNSVKEIKHSSLTLVSNTILFSTMIGCGQRLMIV